MYMYKEMEFSIARKEEELELYDLSELYKLFKSSIAREGSCLISRDFFHVVRDVLWNINRICCGNETGLTYTVVLGAYYLGRDDPDTQIIQVDKAVRHPLFNVDTSFDYDVALVFLRKPAKIVDSAVAIVPKLSNKKLDEQAFQSGSTCVSTGWGTVKQKDGTWGITPILHETRAILVRNRRCERRGYPFDEQWLCLTMNGICYEGTSAPLTCEVNGTWVQLGIFIYYDEFNGCANSIKGHARVSYFRKWIRQEIRAYRK